MLATGWVYSADPVLVRDVTFPLKTPNFVHRVTNPFPNTIKTLVLTSSDSLWNTAFIDPNKSNRTTGQAVDKIKTITESSLIPNSFIMRTVHQNYDVTIPMVVPVDWYLKIALRESRGVELKETIKKQRGFNKNRSTDRAIRLITANFGNMPVSLNIKGDIYIIGAVNVQNQGYVQTSIQDSKSWNLDITQKQNFTIGGNIGDRLSVQVDQNSEADFAWENNLVLNYQGKRDDIWQSGVAGNLSLNLPSSATYVNGGTTKSNGLFGIKTVHQLGPLKATSIISREQVKKSTRNVSGGEAAQEKSIHDYEFIKDKYFFVDEKFKNLFYPLHDNEHIPTNHVLKEYKLYKLDQNNGTKFGTAYLNGDTTSSIVESGRWKEMIENTDYEMDVGYGVIRMITGVSNDAIGIGYIAGYPEATGNVIVDEDNCYAMGDCAGDWNYIYTGEPFTDANGDGIWNPAETVILSSEYQIEFDLPTNSWYEDQNANLTLDPGEEINTAGYNHPVKDNTGTMLFDDTDNNGLYSPGEDYIDTNQDGQFTTGTPIVLKLLKQAGTSTPSKATWPLMLKNVYSVTNSSEAIDPESFEIRILHSSGITGEEEESPNNESFLHIFGIDNLDSQGMPTDSGDGLFDIHSNLINFRTGELFLPMHLPFAYDQNPRKNSFGMYVDQQNGEYATPPADSIFWGNHNPELKNTVNDNVTDLDDDDNNFNLNLDANNHQDDGPSFYYNTSNQNEETQFIIKVKSSKKSTSIDLNAFMIVEGSEEVRLGSRVLRKDVDYNIDYFSGKVNFIPDNCPECVDPTADIQVSFEENELVSFDQKIMIGTAMELKLSDNFQLGMVGIYYNQSIVDEKVDIGYEPVRNFIWDINGKYALKNIDMITNFVDKLPFIETDKPSNFSIEGEFAEVLPNPNPLGEAYLDDFESSKRTTSLGILQRNWKLASTPLGRKLTDRGHLAWYNPANDVLTNSIWPDLQVSTRANTQTTKVLVLQSYFQSDFPTDSLWSGVTTALYPSEYDQSNSKYLDIWLNSSGIPDDSLKLHIDIGFVSEDINGNGTYNTEDRETSLQYNHILDGCSPGESGICEDVGLDGCTDEKENGFGGCLQGVNATYASPGSESVNTASWVNPTDPNGDNWSFELHQQESLNDYRFINGTEGNRNAPGFSFPDSEDLNNDDVLNKRNDYFSYALRPNVDEPVSATQYNGIQTGWKLFRVLLSDFEKSVNGNVNWDVVENVRVWMDGIPPETNLNDTRKLMIAKVEMVRNEWEELGVATLTQPDDFTVDSTFTVTVANTDENSDYNSPPGVQGVYDQYYGIRQREQSLVLSFNSSTDFLGGGIDPDHMVAIKKTFSQGAGFDPLSFKAYKNMEMYVFGGPETGSEWTPNDTSTVNFVFKFGLDNNNYYLIKKPIFPEWDERNHINIDIQKLVRFKLNIESLDFQAPAQDVGLDSTETARENGCGGGAGSMTYANVLAAYDADGSLGYAVNPDFYQLTVQDTITVCGTLYWDELVNGEPRCSTCNLTDPNGDNWVDCTDSSDMNCLENLEGTEGNGQFDFIDNVNPNGLHDPGEICEKFEDVNSNGQFDLPPDSYNSEQDYWEWVDGDCPNCETIRIKGSPSIDRINSITLGVENTTDQKVYGSVMVDELRMTNVKKEKGRKLRLSSSLNFADLMDVSVNMSQGDAEFHSLRERLGTGNNTRSFSVNSTVNPDKLLPVQWGVKTPVILKYSNSVTAPKYIQGTDILSGPFSQVPDSIRTVNQTMQASTSFRKNVKSEKWYVKYTLDNITIDNLTAKYTFTSNNTIRSNISRDYSGKASYRLSFRDHYIHPFKKLEKIPFVGQIIGDTRLYWTPKLFTTSMDVRMNDKLIKKRSGVITPDSSFTLSRNFHLDYQLSKNIQSKYIKQVNSDLYQFSNNKLQAIQHMNPGIIKSVNESLNNSFSPDILPWLKPKLTYNTSYNWSRQNQTTPVTLSSNSDMGVTSTLNLKNLIETFYTPSNRGSSSDTRPGSSNHRPPPTHKKKEIKNPVLLAIVKPLHSMSSKISNITITYKNKWFHQYGSVDGTPDIMFKLGVNGDPGLPLFGDLLANDKHDFSNDLTLNTTISITQKLSTTIKYLQTNLLTQQALKSDVRQIKKSYLPLGDRGDKGIPIPTWSVNWSGFERLPLVNKVFKTLSMTHTYQGDQFISYEAGLEKRADYNMQFSPLFGITGKFKGKVPFDVSFNLKHNISINNDGATTTRTYTDGINSSLTYRRTGGLSVPLFFFRDLNLENDVTFKINVNYDKTYQKKRNTFEGDFLNGTYNNSFSFEPQLTYKFTNYVNGGVHFEYTISDSNTMQKRTFKDFGFDVHIKIAG